MMSCDLDSPHSYFNLREIQFIFAMVNVSDVQLKHDAELRRLRAMTNRALVVFTFEKLNRLQTISDVLLRLDSLFDAEDTEDRSGELRLLCESLRRILAADLREIFLTLVYRDYRPPTAWHSAFFARYVFELWNARGMRTAFQLAEEATRGLRFASLFVSPQYALSSVGEGDDDGRTFVRCKFVVPL